MAAARIAGSLCDSTASGNPARHACRVRARGRVRGRGMGRSLCDINASGNSAWHALPLPPTPYR